VLRPGALPGALLVPDSPALSPAAAAAGGNSVLSDVKAYWDLLSHPDIDDSISRAKSASDAAVLRRKGHLKEQDSLIEFMRRMHETHTCEEVMVKMERWVSVGRRCCCCCC
jgi:IMP and pyridine-specific 5'-nucleotidase